VTLSCNVSCNGNEDTLNPDWRMQVPWYCNAHLFFLKEPILGNVIRQLGVLDDFSVNPGVIQCTTGTDERVFRLQIVGVKTGLNHSVLQCGVEHDNQPYVNYQAMYIIVHTTGKM